MWDPEVGSTAWDEFCEALDRPFRPWDAPDVLSYHEETGVVSVHQGIRVPLPVYNYARYIKEVRNIESQCYIMPLTRSRHLELRVSVPARRH